MQCDVPGSGCKVPVIVTAAVTLPGFAALVTGGLRQLFGLLLQQFVQRFFYTAPDQFFQLTLDYILV